MSYSQAKKCFEENVVRFTTPKDGLNHNLNSGLFQLAQALEHDMRNMKSQLDRLEHDLRRLKNA